LTSVPSRGAASPGKGGTLGLRLLGLALGVFLVFDGLDKRTWLLDSSVFAELLREWRSGAAPSSRWYIETLMLPAIPLFARLIVVGELLAGAALMCGFWTRLGAALGLLVMLNFHLASGDVFRMAFLTDGRGLPVIGGLVALTLSAARLPWSLRH
jgi:uncharacterized membrane protein YphA (DoxX/SURF4 family)